MMTQLLYKNRNWMYKHYWPQEESTTVMAQKAKCGSMTIWRWLRKLDIPVRSRGEGVFLAKRNYLDLSQELLDLIEGELLGDGHIRMNSPRSALYSHGSKYREYVVWLSTEFIQLGVGQAGKIYHVFGGFSPNGGYQYASKSYPELIPIQRRWYPGGEKIVPKDLRLNPINCRQWYLGDGCLKHSKQGRSYITLYTCAFDKLSVDHLINELREQGFKATYHPSDNSIYISTHSTKDFLDWIGPCPEEIRDCYGYKWHYGDSRKPKEILGI